MDHRPPRPLRLPAPLGLAAVVLVCVTFLGSAVVASAATPGTKLWAKRYDGPANGSDWAESLAVSPDGTKVFVTGRSAGSTSYDYATLAYAASTGAKLWTKRYDGDKRSDYAHSLAVSPDGTKVFVTGESSKDYATLAYRASTGVELWAKRYDGPGNYYDDAYSLAVSPDGTKVFVTGTSWGSTSPDYATLAYDVSTGAKLWTKRYDDYPGNYYEAAYSLAVSPDGTKVFVTGESGGSTGPNDYATLAYDASTGAKLWTKRYEGPGNGDDNAYSLAVSPDGTKVFVTGTSWGSTSPDYATLAYRASTGAKLWTRRYDGGGEKRSDYAESLAVSPDGTKVFVTGLSWGSTGPDYATLAYDVSTGAKLWAKRYDGPGNGYDAAYSLAVSPDGTKVFVTGESGGSTSTDHATLAYTA